MLRARDGLLTLTAADLGKLNDGPPGLPSLATFEAVFATNTRRLGEAGDTVEGACEARGGLTRTVGDSVCGADEDVIRTRPVLVVAERPFDATGVTTGLRVLVGDWKAPLA